MFTRNEFLERLAYLTVVEQADCWAILAYLLIMGPTSLRNVRSTFRVMQGVIFTHLALLARLGAIEEFEGQDWSPWLRISPRMVEIVASVNRSPGGYVSQEAQEA